NAGTRAAHRVQAEVGAQPGLGAALPVDPGDLRGDLAPLVLIPELAALQLRELERDPRGQPGQEIARRSPGTEEPVHAGYLGGDRVVRRADVIRDAREDLLEDAQHG